jgi:DNA-binding transcriptional LysR family regulator
MVDDMETFGGALEDLEALAAVVELGSISAAARQLRETKGGISRRISRLERRLGIALLARHARAVTPTEEGLQFYAKMREALALLREAGEEARGANAVPRGRLRITAPNDIALNVLPAMLVQFRASFPQVIVELLLDDQVLDLAAHRIDLALRAIDGPLPDTAYRASTLIEFAFKLYASPDYLATGLAPQTPEALADHAFVGGREAAAGVRRLLLRHKNGRECEQVLMPSLLANGFAGVHRLLLAGGGIGVIPEIDAAEAVAAGSLVPVLPHWHLGRAKLHALSVQGRDAPARVRVFRDFARDYLQRLCGKE